MNFIDFHKLSVTWRVGLTCVLISMAFWYINIDFLVSHYSNFKPFQYPIIVSFCLALCTLVPIGLIVQAPDALSSVKSKYALNKKKKKKKKKNNDNEDVHFGFQVALFAIFYHGLNTYIVVKYQRTFFELIENSFITLAVVLVILYTRVGIVYAILKRKYNKAISSSGIDSI